MVFGLISLSHADMTSSWYEWFMYDEAKKTNRKHPFIGQPRQNY